MGSIHEKNRGKKSRDTAPLNTRKWKTKTVDSNYFHIVQVVY